jgi:hypothetical protein
MKFVLVDDEQEVLNAALEPKRQRPPSTPG